MCKIMEALQEPFVVNELEFRVGATTPDKKQGLALAYVQARAIQNRLDKIFGIGGWKVSYKEITGGFLCKLAVKINEEWIEKEDGSSVTEFESIKGGISSAFKRVASSGFGVGRYLYSIRNHWHPIKQSGKGFSFIGTPTLNMQVGESQSLSDHKEVLKEKINNEIILDFGKYVGKTLKYVFNEDKGYFRYLRDKTKDQRILKACMSIEQN